MLNKNRIKKKFETDSLVLVLDRSRPIGVNKALDPPFYFSPFVVLEEKSNSVIAAPLSTGIPYNLNKNDVKKVPPHDKVFNTLPEIVKEVIIRDYKHLTVKQRAKLIEQDPIHIPLEFNENDIPILEEDYDKEVHFEENN